MPMHSRGLAMNKIRDAALINTSQIPRGAQRSMRLRDDRRAKSLPPAELKSDLLTGARTEVPHARALSESRKQKTLDADASRANHAARRNTRDSSDKLRRSG